MKNKKILFMPVLLIALLNPVPAHAFLWELFSFLFGSGTVVQRRSCVANGDSYACPNKYEHMSNASIEAGRMAMRDAGLKPVASNEDERRGCQKYANGCVDCPGPQHPMEFKSKSGRSIMIAKPGQNYLTQSVRDVLIRMADTRDKHISVTSGYRSCNYQKTRGVGVSRSQHLKGNAADFIFVGAGPTHAALAKYARDTLNQMGRGGGTGTYCSAPAHVDTGNNRQWNWCRRRGR
jgi:hypothetical protein